MALHLAACRLLLPDGIADDTSLRIDDGHIAGIGRSPLPGDTEVDCGGGLLAPGIVDLHCDALEKIIEPRPGVRMPQAHVMPAAEALYAAAGITTIFHAISFASGDLGVRSLEVAAAVVRDVRSWREHGVIDHRVHARYEVSDPAGLPLLCELLDQGALDLVSVMDHTPGQGQFRSLDAFVAFHVKTYKSSEAEARALAAAKQADAIAGWVRAEHLLRQAAAAGVVSASHDDDGVERVQRIRDWGGRISEFPIDLATLTAASEAGMSTVLGAPNLIRGGSQSGNLRALDAVRSGRLDCLCADYVPWTMAAAACRLPELAGLSWPAAWALVAAHPARAAGLEDRGRIAEGLRADLVQLAQVRGQPQVVATWVGGHLAYRAQPPAAMAWSARNECLAT